MRDSIGDKLGIPVGRYARRLWRVGFLGLICGGLSWRATAADAVAPPEMKALQARVQALEEQQAAAADSLVSSDQSRFTIGLFGDINFSSESRDVEHAGFALGQTDLYGVGQVGDRINSLLELVMEYDGADPVADLERIWVGYTVNDALTLKFGKDHPAYGCWDKMFHHGALLYTTIGRPFFLKFEDEGAAIPAHTTGPALEGRLPVPGAQLKYELQVGNGASVVPGPEGLGELDQQAVNDDNDDKLYILRLSAAPDGLPGFHAAVFGSYTRALARSDDPAFTAFVVYEDAPQTIVGADLSYTAGAWELLAEYFNIRNDIEGENDAVAADGALLFAADAQRTANHAFYVQVGRTFWSRWTPYTRVEQLWVDEMDAYMYDLNMSDRRQLLAGLKFDLVPARNSVKLQYRRDHLADGVTRRGEATQQDFDVVEFQWAFGF